MHGMNNIKGVKVITQHVYKYIYLLQLALINSKLADWLKGHAG